MSKVSVTINIPFTVSDCREAVTLIGFIIGTFILSKEPDYELSPEPDVDVEGFPISIG